MPYSIDQWHRSVQERLIDRGYVAIEPSTPIRWAFLRPAHGLHVTSLVGVVNGLYSTDSPTRTFERVEEWFGRTCGSPGEGLLLILYAPALATTVREIERSRFYAGSIAVAAGAYDLTTEEHWLSYSGGWEDLLFGS